MLQLKSVLSNPSSAQSYQFAARSAVNSFVGFGTSLFGKLDPVSTLIQQQQQQNAAQQNQALLIQRLLQQGAMAVNCVSTSSITSPAAELQPVVFAVPIQADGIISKV